MLGDSVRQTSKGVLRSLCYAVLKCSTLCYLVSNTMLDGLCNGVYNPVVIARLVYHCLLVSLRPLEFGQKVRLSGLKVLLGSLRGLLHGVTLLR